MTSSYGIGLSRVGAGGGETGASTRRLGVLHGEGIGPEVVGAALDVLAALEGAAAPRIEIVDGPAIGPQAVGHLTHAEAGFCRGLFESGAPLLSGPRGGRFVYELRERFGLFCKLTPVQPLSSLEGTGPLRAPRSGADLLFVRENVSGLYFGSHRAHRAQGVLEEVHHAFGYRREEVLRVVRLAAELAAGRRGRLSVAVKTGGVPSISAIWRECAAEACDALGVALEVLEIDNACYQVVADPMRFDVVVSPNMFGDILADVAALLLGSRGLSHSANFGEGGRAVYQTGHGAARDLAGTNRANPVGQILSLASLLDESFRLHEAAAATRAAVDAVLAEGWRTGDLMAEGCTEVGTRELGKHIAERAHALAVAARAGK